MISFTLRCITSQTTQLPYNSPDISLIDKENDNLFIVLRKFSFKLRLRSSHFDGFWSNLIEDNDLLASHLQIMFAWHLTKNAQSALISVPKIHNNRRIMLSAHWTLRIIQIQLYPVKYFSRVSINHSSPI